ncbi:efflux RND transporter permease subunit [Halioxenophilus aromaticivorans]|uniref:Efflux RND transporter permease subunit n=1 Tax=Halioxenophilus aromaticivorans TaxID=1306992 RepID=A0AAV3U363_9ALTE
MTKDSPETSSAPTAALEEENAERNIKSGIIGYFAHNPVAANLLMWFIIILGLVSYLTISRQMFPNIELDMIQIQANYPGASPQEIEEGIMIKVEEALKDVTEIDRIVTRSFRNSGMATLEIDTEADLAETMDKVKLRVDGIATFPAEMEPLTVYQVEFRQEIIDMALTGDVPVQDLKPLAKQLEDELLNLNQVNIVEVEYPDDEISIEVDPQVLREYGLSLADVSNAISAYSSNMSAGQLRSQGGIVSVRLESQSYSGEEFSKIPVKIGQDGAKVLLGEIAEIKDSFVEGEHYLKFSGQNAIYFSVKGTADQNTVDVSKQVKQWLDQRRATLPSGIELQVLVDTTYYLNGRLDMMKKNLFMGALLVGVMLTIFLRLKLAIWVMIGLPICFLGAMLLMPFFGVTINVVSLFGFIMVLGIVVDDAIVIGESAFSEIEKNGNGVRSVVIGTKRVATPATFGVLTTIAVFAPFTMSTGPESAFFVGIAVVVMLCLLFSLIESKLILPAHLAHTKFGPVKPGSWRFKFNAAYSSIINNHYRSLVEKCLGARYLVLAVFVGVLIISFSLISANLVRVVPTPPVPHDFPSINIELSDNVSDSAIVDALVSVDEMVMAVEAETIEKFGRGMIRDRLVINTDRTEGFVLVSFVDEDQRDYDAYELARIWRERMPEIVGLKSIVVIDDVNTNPDAGGEFGYLLTGLPVDQLNAAGRKFVDLLNRQRGVFDVSSTIDPVGKEIQLNLLPVAYNLGLTATDIAQQVGVSFYGGEAQRVIRDGEELKVMVRYPELTRQSFTSLKYAYVTTPSGREVMLGDVVELVEKPGIGYIRREGGRLSVYVYGSLDEVLLEPSQFQINVDEQIIPELKSLFPGLSVELGGELAKQNEQSNEQVLFFIAGLLMIYILLAVPLKSYAQPLIIMSIIPFSLTGAIWGHFVLGMDLSMMSTFGLIAAAGVVINDSLVMTDYINQVRRTGLSIRQAVVEAGCMRFRPITLTSITTFCGVMPIMFETSLQARFVIPMAVSLGCAVLFATVITLILVPCMYLILQDLGNLFTKRDAKVQPDNPEGTPVSAGG